MAKSSRKQKPRPLAEWLASFGEPIRLALIRELGKRAQTVTSLCREVGAEMVTVSYHLKIMRKSVTVVTQREGRFIIYSLVGATLKGATLELSHSSGAKVSLPLE